MKTAERLFYVALALQVIHLLVSIALSAEWVLTAIFWLWVGLVPVIAFAIGRRGGTAGQAARIAATLAFSWFFLGTLGAVFWRTVPPNLWLTGIAGLAISCLVGGAVLLMIAIVLAKVGARISAAA